MPVDREILPYPIAMAYQRIRACHGKDARRLKYILQTAEMTARFLGVVALSDLREQLKAGRLAPPAALQNAVGRLRRPAFGHWIEIVREAVRLLQGLDTAFMPELASVVFKAKSGALAAPFQLLSDAVILRNRFAHGDMKPAEIAKACDPTAQAMDDILGALGFFERYPTYYVRRISVRKRRLGESSYEHDFCLMSGALSPPEAVSEPRPWHTDANEVIVMGPEGAYLNLDPLVVFYEGEDEDSDPTILPDMYVLNGYDKKSAGPDIAYLPCGLGREIKSRELPDEDWRVLLGQGLLEYEALFLPSSVADAPQLEVSHV